MSFHSLGDSVPHTHVYTDQHNRRSHWKLPGLALTDFEPETVIEWWDCDLKQVSLLPSASISLSIDWAHRYQTHRFVEAAKRRPSPEHPGGSCHIPQGDPCVSQPCDSPPHVAGLHLPTCLAGLSQPQARMALHPQTRNPMEWSKRLSVSLTSMAASPSSTPRSCRDKRFGSVG